MPNGTKFHAFQKLHCLLFDPHLVAMTHERALYCSFGWMAAKASKIVCIHTKKEHFPITVNEKLFRWVVTCFYPWPLSLAIKINCETMAWKIGSPHPYQRTLWVWFKNYAYLITVFPKFSFHLFIDTFVGNVSHFISLHSIQCIPTWWVSAHVINPMLYVFKLIMIVVVTYLYLTKFPPCCCVHWSFYSCFYHRLYGKIMVK